MEQPPKKRKKVKFRVKITRTLVLVTVIPLIFISFTSIYNVIQTRKQNISELQGLAVNTAGEKVKKFIKDLEINLLLNTTVENISMATIDKAGFASVQNIVNAIYKQREQYIEEISIVDKNGYVLQKIPMDQGEVLGSIGSTELFQKAVGGGYYYGEVEHIDDKSFMTMSEPIRDDSGKVVGVITSRINLNVLSSIINSIKLGDAGYIYIVDSHGRLIAGPDNKYFKPGQNMMENHLIRGVLAGNARNGLAKDDIYLHLSGEEVIFSGRALKEAAEEKTVNWFVMSEWPRDDAFAVIDRIINRSIAIILASLLLAVMIGLFLVRQIVKPIDILHKAAKEVRKGNLNYRVQLRTGDEFEELGKNFNKMAKVLKENQTLRDEFVFIAAHELRTPVTATKGYLDMIFEGSFGDVPKDIRTNLDIVYRANERLVQLVHDLLEVARSEAGRMKIELKPLDIRENIKSTVEQLSSLAKEKNINISYSPPAELPKVLADSYKVNELITNILGNAIKYTLDDGDIKIRHEAKDGQVWTHIKDHGIGMKPEDVANLFSKFYRVQNEKTKKIEGTGLGLYVCKEIVERMGGGIKVESEWGRGSTFSFSLKTADKEKPQAE